MHLTDGWIGEMLAWWTLLVLVVVVSHQRVVGQQTSWSPRKGNTPLICKFVEYLEDDLSKRKAKTLQSRLTWRSEVQYAIGDPFRPSNFESKG